MADPGVRIALVHALAHSIAPINAEFARAWPEARRMNLLDDSLSADLAASPSGLDERMTGRFLALAGYAIDTGAAAILFTCSAFGPCIDAVARRWPDRPVLKPNEAMIDDAVALARAGARRVALVATFAPTLASMPAEFPGDVEVVPVMVEAAMDALDRGDGATHDRLAAEAVARAVTMPVDAVALSQFSLARAAGAVARATNAPVLTTPGSAVRALRARLFAR
ncbi:MAG: arylsulfatase [Betaproteobacteria bacterium]|nr:arylsulfatase [Betaproteobacteria bacterium]